MLWTADDFRGQVIIMSKSGEMPLVTLRDSSYAAFSTNSLLSLTRRALVVTHLRFFPRVTLGLRVLGGASNSLAQRAM